MRYIFLWLITLPCITMELNSSMIGHTQPVLPRKIPMNELTAGVLMLKGSAKGTITIYDLQNREWQRLNLDSSLQESIKPYSGFLEYENLVFRVVQTDADFYQVIVNEESGATGKITKTGSPLSFQQWDEHVLNVFSIDFDPKTNPLKKDTTNGVRAVYRNDVEFFHPVLLRGDWLKLKWETRGGHKFGWVKWKKGNKLLVDLNYIP